MTQRQLTFNDVEELRGWLDGVEEVLQQQEIDETPTKCDDVCEKQPPLIKQVITNYLQECAETRILPSFEDAKTIAILDSILSKYNA